MTANPRIVTMQIFELFSERRATSEPTLDRGM